MQVNSHFLLQIFHIFSLDLCYFWMEIQLLSKKLDMLFFFMSKAQVVKNRYQKIFESSINCVVFYIWLNVIS